MSQSLTPITVPAGDYQTVLSLPIEVGTRKIKLRVRGETAQDQLFTRLRRGSGLEVSSASFDLDISQDNGNQSGNATVFDLDLNPPPNDEGIHPFILAVNATLVVTQAGNLEYAAALFSDGSVDILAALYEV